MNKLITKVAAISLGLAMALGVGVAVGSSKKEAVPVSAASTTGSVTLSGGTYDTDHITWLLKSGSTTVVTIQQTKGSSSTAVNSSYISSPRVYKGHVLSFVASSDYVINSITITCDGAYYGDSMTAGTEMSGTTVTDNTTDVSRTWTTTTDGDHVVSANPTTGLSTIYIQNVASSSNVQLRFTALSIEYSEKSKDPISVTGVSLNKTSTSISVGKTEKLIATVTPSTADDTSVTWSSDDSGVASVSNAGVVTAVSEGTTQITVETTDGNFTASCEVTVTPAPAYSTDFESDFTTGTSYQTTTTTGPDDYQWETYYGTPSSSNPIVNGTISMQMRKYNGMTGNPYTQMLFDVTNGHSISFIAKGNTANNYGVEVFYSTDSGETYTSLLTKSVGTTNTAVSAEIATWVSKARFKIEFTGANPSSGNKQMSIDDIEIYTMAKPTTPVVTITSKDGSGFMSGVLGDTQEVTYETDNDTGLTISWTLVDSDQIVEWDSELLAVAFENTGADATLTVELKDSSNNVKASDTVTLRTLVPTVTIKYNNQDRAKLTIYSGDTGTLTAEVTNQPVGASASIVWSSDDTTEDYLEFDNGYFIGVSAGKVNVTVSVMYSGVSYASDSLEFTINALGEKTLVVSTNTGKTTYKFGETLDTTGWTAIYSDGRGNETDVISSLSFGSLDYIGTKALTASYEGVVSNAINITITNNGATPNGSVVSDNLETSTTTSNLSANAEQIHSLSSTINGVTAVSISLKAQVTGTSGTSYTHGVTFKIYDSNDNVVGTSSEVSVSSKPSSSVTWSTSISVTGSVEVTRASYTLTTKQGGSNLRQRSFDIQLTYNDPTYAPRQALAWARYFLEQTDGYCEGTISSDVKTNIINEFNWMQPEAKTAFKAASIVRGKGASYDDDLSEALSRYVNMLEDKGYIDSEFLNLGDEVVKKASSNQMDLFNKDNGSISAIIVIVSLVSITAIGAYFFIMKRKEQ